MSSLSIRERDERSNARVGQIETSHGALQTPAFIPLATKGSVKGLAAEEVDQLGYEMVLGNTFHLFLEPGPDLVSEFGGLHEFMRWSGPIITDSGGFQVFSMGHGTVADEVKGRAPKGSDRAGKILSIEEEGVRFRSYVDGSEQFIGPETSMEIQAKLGSDIALVFDECTPFHVSRQYTQRSTERTHRWLDRCLEWHQAHSAEFLPKGTPKQLVYGIIQGGVHEDLRRESARVIAASACDGIAIGGSLGENKAQMYEVVGWAIDELPEDRPRHLLGIGEVDDLIRGVELGIDTFDCAMPTRLARHGTAIIPAPEARWRLDLSKSTWRTSQEILLDGCPCPACSNGYTRGYLNYLLRAKELTGQRLLTLHNLTFFERLMEVLREAIARGELSKVAMELRSGASVF